ncbi:MAG: hypothetical protein JO122_18955 [Acetobacteraceae bacterium]|nr:hypothetical protein [Acetobacteraceae bacterium]
MRLVIAAAVASMMIGGAAFAQYSNPSQTETQSAPGQPVPTNMPSSTGVVTSQVPSGTQTLPNLQGTTNQGNALPPGNNTGGGGAGK